MIPGRVTRWRWIRSGWRGGDMRIATSASRIDRSSSRIVDHQADLDLGIEVEEFADARRQPDRAERRPWS